MISRAAIRTDETCERRRELKRIIYLPGRPVHGAETAAERRHGTKP